MIENPISCNIKIIAFAGNGGRRNLPATLIGQNYDCEIVYCPLKLSEDDYAHTFRIINIESNSPEENLIRKFSYFHPIIYHSNMEKIYEGQEGLLLVKVRDDGISQFSCFHGPIVARVSLYKEPQINWIHRP